MEKLLLLVLLAGIGYVVYRQITARKAERTSGPKKPPWSQTCVKCRRASARRPGEMAPAGRALPLQGRSQGSESLASTTPKHPHPNSHHHSDPHLTRRLSRYIVTTSRNIPTYILETI